MAKEIKYEIIEHIADLDPESKVWGKEVNIMTWGNSKTPVIDIRKWNRSDEENIIAGKGVSLSLEEFEKVTKINIKNIRNHFV